MNNLLKLEENQRVLIWNKQESAGALRYFSLIGRKKTMTEHIPNHLQKETKSSQKNLDADFVGRIQAGSFKEL